MFHIVLSGNNLTNTTVNALSVISTIKGDLLQIFCLCLTKKVTLHY
jgi:hypothetical protein